MRVQEWTQEWNAHICISHAFYMWKTGNLIERRLLLGFLNVQMVSWSNITQSGMATICVSKPLICGHAT